MQKSMQRKSQCFVYNTAKMAGEDATPNPIPYPQYPQKSGPLREEL